MNNDNCTAKTEFSATKTMAYSSWQGMKNRCYNINNPHYKDYGARGIVVCDRWLNSFCLFFVDMGERPKNLSIDRIDNDKGYSPENCRWATRSQQNHNQRTRKANKTGVTGVWFDKKYKNWQVQIKINKKRIRLGIHNNFLDACCARKSAENRVNNL